MGEPWKWPVSAASPAHFGLVAQEPVKRPPEQKKGPEFLPCLFHPTGTEQLEFFCLVPMGRMKWAERTEGRTSEKGRECAGGLHRAEP